MEQTNNSAQIPSTYSRIIARMLGLQERELGLLLQGTALPTEILLPGDETGIGGPDQIRILENGYRLMKTPGFGLALGAQLGPSSHGPVGYLSLASPDLLTALRAFAEFIPVRLPILSITVAQSTQWLDCVFRTRLHVPAHIEQAVAESFAVSIQGIVEEILRRRAHEAKITFQHARPSYIALYDEQLHGSCEFDGAEVRYRLPADLAYATNNAGDSNTVRVTRDLCDSILATQSQVNRTYADRVRTLLLTNPHCAVTEDEVAKAMFVSRRTLARRLDSEDTGFRKIRDDVLRGLATGLLHGTTQSVESVSISLGYNDSAAFRKAFRRWTGMSPTEYRRETFYTTHKLRSPASAC